MTAELRQLIETPQSHRGHVLLETGGVHTCSFCDATAVKIKGKFFGPANAFDCREAPFNEPRWVTPRGVQNTGLAGFPSDWWAES